MSQLYDHIRKKYVVCIVFAHQGLRKPHSVLRYPVTVQCRLKFMDFINFPQIPIFISSPLPRKGPYKMVRSCTSVLMDCKKGGKVLTLIKATWRFVECKIFPLHFKEVLIFVKSESKLLVLLVGVDRARILLAWAKLQKFRLESNRAKFIFIKLS